MGPGKLVNDVSVPMLWLDAHDAVEVLPRCRSIERRVRCVELVTREGCRANVAPGPRFLAEERDAPRELGLEFTATFRVR